jgi:Uma2 family endonuclease
VVAARLVRDLNVILKENYPTWSLMPQPINLELETDHTTFHCEPDLSLFDQSFEAVLANEDLLPAIVIEIVSPGNPENDYVRKVQAYAEMGIPEYWIVDPRHSTVTFLQLASKDGKEWYEQIDRSQLISEFAVNVESLFAGIH